MRLTVVLLLALLWAAPAPAQQLRVYFIDVDQADATLIVSPSGNTLLVDSGMNGHGSRIQSVMQQAGVTQIDHFVATHYHEDHYGGIDDLVNAGVTVLNAYDRGDKEYVDPDRLESDTYEDYHAAVGHRAEHLTRGETIPLDASMVVTAVSSGGVVLTETTPTEHGHDENRHVHRAADHIRRLPDVGRRGCGDANRGEDRREGPGDGCGCLPG